MKILVTGAKGFVGRNLCSQLKNIRDGKARWYGLLPASEAANANAEAANAPKEQVIEAIFEYDINSTPEELDSWCQQADFVFNLAVVNRPQDLEEFIEGNFGFATIMLKALMMHHGTCLS